MIHPLTKRLSTTCFMWLAAACLLLAASSCKKDCPDPMSEACDDTVLPVVMAHGLLASGDTYSLQIKRFASNNICADRFYLFDYNTLDFAADNATLLDNFIDNVLAETGADKVMLVGHSAGSSLGYNYLADSLRSTKVDRYIHLAGNPQPQPAGPSGNIPTLNMYSAADLIVTGGDMTGATNIDLVSDDHYEVATSPAAFQNMFEFMYGSLPGTTLVESENSDQIMLQGKAVTLGENVPVAGATVEVYEVSSTDGSRINASPDAEFTVAADGSWGPFEAKTATHYEFFITGTSATDRPIHYYREPFMRSDRNIYLRTLPPPSSFAGALLAGLPQDDTQTVLAIFTSNQAAIWQRDALDINGNNLATEDLCSADQSTIALFLYDENGNDASDFTRSGTFATFPFLNGADVYTPTASPSSVALTFNGVTLNVPNWKSDTEGLIVAVFN